MLDSLKYVKLDSKFVSRDVLQTFDCGHPDFNEFLADDAESFADDGKGVTYILVDSSEYENKKITSIFAFATIQTASLQYVDDEECLRSIPSVEIKYFAIAKRFQKQTAWMIDKNKYYSTLFFEWFLSDLYHMSTAVVGFRALFLRANEKGEKLYRRKRFVDATEYSIPFDEDDAAGKCIPMCLMIEENLYSIFGEDFFEE